MKMVTSGAFHVKLTHLNKIRLLIAVVYHAAWMILKENNCTYANKSQV